MTKDEKNQFPDGMQEKFQKHVQEAFRSFADHSREMKEDIVQHKRRHREIKESINRGARRTDGRIV